jgi:hypothetical protein
VAPFVPDALWLQSLGLSAASFRQLMRALGYRSEVHAGVIHFVWRGASVRPRSRRRPDDRTHSPFAVLAQLKKG